MVGTTTRTPRPFIALVGLLALSGLTLFAAAWVYLPTYWSIQLILVIVVAALSELFAFQLPNFTVVLAYPLAMSAVVLGGPAASGLVALCSSGTVSDLRRHRPSVILAFNLSLLVSVSCAAGWTYVLLGGPVLATGPNTFRTLSAQDFPAALYGMLGCALVAALGNLLLVSFGTALYQGQGFRRIFRPVLPLLPTQIALPFVGFLMAQVLALSWVALPLFIFPLIVARQFYQRSMQLREAYVGTVRSLIGALEAKDTYTRGHSERVAGYAIQLGRHVGLDDAAIDRLEYAALLHDLGKLAVPSQILTKPGRLSAEEWESIREHPARGAEMVARIPPLKDLAEQVGKHHEWYGGGGYPDAVSSNDIPLVALILSVADCYDAMTTTRAYRRALTRDEAVAELIAGAGTQFDPNLVRAFIEARIGAEPPQLEQTANTAVSVETARALAKGER